MIVLMGVSGAGKGTQSQLLARDLGYRCLSTGEILRIFATDVQKQQIMQGNLLTDAEMFNVVDTALLHQEEQNNVILDGFPRTIPQAAWLLEHAKGNTYQIEAIINLQVSADVVHARLNKRGRTDDTAEAIEKRIAWHNQNAETLINYFKQHHVPFYDIDGSREPEVVHQSIITTMKKSI